MRMTTMSGAALLLALAGCGQQAATDRQGGADSAAPAQGTFATPDGTGEVRTGAAALTGLPEGIPAYPGADTSASIQISGAAAEGEGRILGFRTADPPDRVIAFYAEAAERAGFTIDDGPRMGGGSALTAERANGDVLQVVATASPAGTQVQIVAGRERRNR